MAAAASVDWSVLDILQDDTEDAAADSRPPGESQAPLGPLDERGDISSLSPREWAYMCCLLDPDDGQAPDAGYSQLRVKALDEHPHARARRSPSSRLRSAADVLRDAQARRLSSILAKEATRVEELKSEGRAPARARDADAGSSWSPHPTAAALSPTLRRDDADGAATALAALAAWHRHSVAMAQSPSAEAPVGMRLAMSLLATACTHGGGEATLVQSMADSLAVEQADPRPAARSRVSHA